MARDFADKSAARQWVWDRLGAEGVARFPFPPHGRIPNFAGAEVAAARLLDIEPWKSAKRIICVFAKAGAASKKLGSSLLLDKEYSDSRARSIRCAAASPPSGVHTKQVFEMHHSCLAVVS